MNAAVEEMTAPLETTSRYARCVVLSKRAEWQIDRDLIRGRDFDLSRRFLPDGLSMADRLTSLSPDEARLFSQVQGRTYAYLFGLVERFIGAKMLDQGRTHSLGDQHALEALLRFSNEELKHQELFRRIETMLAPRMAEGYRQIADPNDVARAVLAARGWAVLALTCHIELFVQAHYAESIAPRAELCPLFRDVFQFHWRDECQHVVLDELEWKREHARSSLEEIDAAVDDLIGLVGAVDGLLLSQAAADAEYFVRQLERPCEASERERIFATLRAAYRWQYIISGVRHPHFGRLLSGLTTPAQLARIQAALAPILADA